MRQLSLALAVLFTLSTPTVAGTPWFRLVAPPQGQAIGGRNVEVSVSYNTGSDVRVDYMELEVDGQRIMEREFESPAVRGVSSFRWDATEYPNGKHRITVKLYAGDRLLGSASGEYSVANKPPDVTPPLIEFFNVKPGQLLQGEVELQIRATDDSGEPPLVSLFVDRQLKLLKNSSPYNYLWDTTIYEDGEHVIEAWAYDAAGNRTVAPALNVIIRNQMAPLRLAQTETPDRATAAGSTTAPAKELKATGEPIVAAAPLVAPQSPAIPIALPRLQSAAARTVEPGTAAGGVSSSPLQSPPAIQTAGPLVEFIEPARPGETVAAVMEPEVSRAEVIPPAALTLPVVPVASAASEPVHVDSPALRASETMAALMEPEVNKAPANVPVARTLPALPVASAAREPVHIDSPALRASETMAAVMEPEVSKAPANVPVAQTLPVLPVATVAGLPAHLESPTLGPWLTVPDYLSPVVSLPETVQTQARVALLPRDELLSSLDRVLEPPFDVPSRTKVVALSTADIPAGRMKAEMYGEQFAIDAEICRGIPVAPLRQIWEHTGGQLFWYPETQTVKGFSREVDLELTMGSKKAIVNNLPVFMPIAPYVDEGRTMVGLALLQYAFRMDLEYNSNTGQFALVVR